jgi:hypothetical protein
MNARGEVEFEGHTFEWTVEREEIRVSHPVLGTKSTQLGGSHPYPKVLARMMAGELIRESRRRKPR